VELLKIPESERKLAWEWAEGNWDKHYSRFGLSRKQRVEKVYIGKLAELGGRMIFGGRVNFKEEADEGWDLEVSGVRFAIKSKKVREIPASLKNYYCHIPKDQYDKIRESCEYVAFFFIKNDRDPIKWEICFVGYVPITMFDSMKVLHRAGMQLSKNFKLHGPDSWGVPLQKFKDVYDINKTHHP